MAKPWAAKASGKAAVSPAANTPGWLARICSIRVVPERGMPTMNTGSSEGPPLPAFDAISPGVKAAAMAASCCSADASS